VDISEYWNESYFDVINNVDNIFNYAVKAYEPGSVLKVITMAAALDAGAVERDTEFLDTGEFKIGGITIRNWDRGAWGPQTMTTCLQHSLNVCLAWVGSQLGAEQLYSYFQSFGFGQLTGVGLSNEAPGVVKNYLSSDWHKSELGTNSFGQGIEVTPIQMLKAVSAIANNGIMVSPRIVSAIVDQEYRYEAPIDFGGSPISAETAQTLTGMLTQSLEKEASSALVPGYSLAGKTGTGEIYVKGEGYTTSLTNASFIGWGPTDDPQFIVYVWISKPTTSIWGSVVASPIFRQVVNRVIIHLGIPPDAVRHNLQEDV
ncbi:MAG: penicillin-binding transpeptidase domain-containing protein, partial [Chloroflexota bacterium]|nr:penicillin-binding transpeptidase domain-containing protein [Chloroflexota bacterium]